MDITIFFNAYYGNRRSNNVLNQFIRCQVSAEVNKEFSDSLSKKPTTFIEVELNDFDIEEEDQDEYNKIGFVLQRNIGQYYNLIESKLKDRFRELYEAEECEGYFNELDNEIESNLNKII